MTMFGICDCCKQANPLRFKNGQYLCDWCVAEYEELESDIDDEDPCDRCENPDCKICVEG